MLPQFASFSFEFFSAPLNILFFLISLPDYLGFWFRDAQVEEISASGFFC